MKQLFKKGQWKIDYDPECDEMFVGVIPQPKGININSEGVMYHFTEDGKISGFFIEYFKTLGCKEYKKIKTSTLKGSNSTS